MQLVPNGELHLQYAPEVDNIVGTRCLENCLFGPCYDTEGQLRGVIQLINKEQGEPISFQDEREFENLLPTVGEMIKQADDVKYVNDVSANMSLQLAVTRDSILNSAKVYEERNLSKVHAAMAQIVNKVENFSKLKQKNTIIES